MHKQDPTVLVVGNPSVAVAVRKAVPTWRVIETHTDTGVALVRTHRSTINLIVLDLWKEFDGIMMCLRIRTEAPKTPILAFTDSPGVATLLTRIGCLPPLLKSAPLEARREMLHRALNSPAAPLPSDPLITYTYHLANRLEDELNGQRAAQLLVAVFAMSEILRNGLREVIAQAGGTVRIHTTSPTVLHNRLAESRVTLIIADSMAYNNALILAQEFGLPLLVVALTTTAGYRVSAGAQGVVVEPVQCSTMAEAMQALTTGATYYDQRLLDPFAMTPLTKTERKIGRLILQEKRLDMIARELSLQPNTLRWHVSNIYAKLGVDSLEAIRAWVDTETAHSRNVHRDA
jgi:DNA-binding NarL/FixJ family response regulator